MPLVRCDPMALQAARPARSIRQGSPCLPLQDASILRADARDEPARLPRGRESMTATLTRREALAAGFGTVLLPATLSAQPA